MYIKFRYLFGTKYVLKRPKLISTLHKKGIKMELKARVLLIYGLIPPLFTIDGPFLIVAWLPYLICSYFYFTKRYLLAFSGAILPAIFDTLLLFSRSGSHSSVDFGIAIVYVAPLFNMLVLMPIGLVASDLFMRLKRKNTPPEHV